MDNMTKKEREDFELWCYCIAKTGDWVDASHWFMHIWDLRHPEPPKPMANAIGQKTINNE
jgi:hypothetical protein